MLLILVDMHVDIMRIVIKRSDKTFKFAGAVMGDDEESVFHSILHCMGLLMDADACSSTERICSHRAVWSSLRCELPLYIQVSSLTSADTVVAGVRVLSESTRVIISSHLLLLGGMRS